MELLASGTWVLWYSWSEPWMAQCLQSLVGWHLTQTLHILRNLEVSCFPASSHQESSFELRCCCFSWIPFSGLLAASDLSLERVTHKLHEASCLWWGPLVEWNSHLAELLISKGTKTWEAHCLVSVMSKRKGVNSHFLQMIQGFPSSP